MLIYIIIATAFSQINLIQAKDTDFKLGIENVSIRSIPSSKRVGLITNQTGVDQAGKKNVDVLLSKKINLKAIYAPEHGITGKVLAEKKIQDQVDEHNVPVVSLYEGDSKFKKFDSKNLEDIDLFVFDIQDSGMRHYTYISILYKMMEVAVKFNKSFMVLDRPNPLGIPMEGPLVKSTYISFISIAPIPLRHAMTVGELAKYFNKYHFDNGVKLQVIPMKNYKRTRGLNGTLPVFLSPNITTISACLNYSFLGIMGEIAPINVGVGTEYAFECIALPTTLKFPIEKWDELKKILLKHNVDSTFLKYSKMLVKYVGLKIKIKDINNFSSFNTLIAVLNFFKQNGIKLSYSPAFNKVIGNSHFQELLGKNSYLKVKFSNLINQELHQFFDDVKDLLIYQPLPKVFEVKL